MEATRPHRYTAEQRDAALELYREVGPAEAGRRLGIPSGTVRSWRAATAALRMQPKIAVLRSKLLA